MESGYFQVTLTLHEHCAKDHLHRETLSKHTRVGRSDRWVTVAWLRQVRNMTYRLRKVLNTMSR